VSNALIHAHTENIFSPATPVPMVRMQNVIVSSVQTIAHCFETSSKSPLGQEINAAIKIVPTSDYCSLNIHFTTTVSQLVILQAMLHVMIHEPIPEQRFNIKCVAQRFVLWITSFLRVSRVPVLPTKAYLYASLRWRDKGKTFLRSRIQTSLN